RLDPAGPLARREGCDRAGVPRALRRRAGRGAAAADRPRRLSACRRRRGAPVDEGERPLRQESAPGWLTSAGGAIRRVRCPRPVREETTTMADSTDFMAQGREIAGKLWGARAGGQELPAQRLAPEFFALVTQFVFGGFWARPNLDLRSRSLCTVAQLAALGKIDELKGHRSEEHTSELQSLTNLVCPLLLAKKH